MKTLKNLFNIFILFIIILFNIMTTSFGATEEVSTYSPTCLLMEASTGKVIYEKNGYEKAYPASTTKIMTAILTLEHCNLTDVATASYEAVYSVPVGYSNANIQVGEELTINQLLNVLLINSANEAANVLAEHIAGSVDSFATMMNAKAEEIGCLNTHFVNPNGVHNENHYSTAYDLALMGRYAMKNDIFREFVNTKFYTLPATNKYLTNDRVFGTTNELLKKDTRDSVDNYYYEYCTGIKTGYTNAAKSCIVASAKKDDIEYIVVILGAGTTDNGLSARYLDCKTLFNYAFKNYTVKKLNDEEADLKTINIPNGTLSTKHLKVKIQDEINVLLKKSTDTTNLTPTVEINKDLSVPIVKNSIVGKITYTIDGNEYTSNLIAGNNVYESNTVTNILTIVSIIIVLYLLFKLLNLNNKKKVKKNKKNKYLYW